MASEDGSSVTKMMNLEQLRLSQGNALSIDDLENDANMLQVYPNPMSTTAMINFSLAQNETVQFVVYDQLGKQVYKTTLQANAGRNEIVFNRTGLSSGLYFCKIISSQYTFNPLKLIIN